MEESIFAATDSKAARALLGWTQGDLAKACNVSVSTIADFEKGDRVPIAANLTALRQGFEAAGIVFTSDGPTAYGEVSFWLMTEEVQTTLRFRYSFNQGAVVQEIVAAFGAIEGDVISIDGEQVATPELKAAIDELVQRHGKAAPQINKLRKIIHNLANGEHFLLLPASPASTEDRLKLENFLHDLNHPGAKGNSRGGETNELFGPLLAKYDISLPRTDRHTMVGAGEDQQVCRFCGQTRADGATFGKQAHVIPTALGNDFLKSREECDLCNEFFGQATEPSLIFVLDIERVFLGIEGRAANKNSGRPKLKFGRDHLHHDGSKVVIGTHSFSRDEQGVVEINLGKGATYVPQAVYRAMVKIVLSVVDADQLPHLKKTIEWVRHGQHADQALPMVATAQINLPPNPSAQISVYTRRAPDPRLPHMIGEFRLGCFMFVFAVPFSDEDNWNLVGFFEKPDFTSLFKHYGTVGCWVQRDFSGTDEVTLSPMIRFVPR